MSVRQPKASSDRVYIRHLSPSDRLQWLQVRVASRDLHQPWEPAPPPGFDPWSDEAFDLALATCNQVDRQRFLVFERSTNQLVAQVGLSQICRGPFNSAVMGYWGSALTAGSGYVAAGVRLVISHAFTPTVSIEGLSVNTSGLGLHRVEANIIPENLASIRVVRSVGMWLEGFSPRYLQIAGTYRDHLRFAITSDCWDVGCNQSIARV
jgi:ribosomal-protein-alanine N-acetyltransferase